MKSLASLTLWHLCSLAVMVPAASAEILYDKQGIWFRGTAHIVCLNAATGNVREENYPAAHYDDANDLINRADSRQVRGESGPAAPGGESPEPSGILVGETVVFDGMDFVGIPPGEFVMGSTSRYAFQDEKPVTRVTIGKGFYLGKYEVTQAQWRAVMGKNPSGFAGCIYCPVEQVSWEEVQVFIGKLNARSGGGRYRLPTEAEWEYSARAGTTGDTYAGDITRPFGSDPVLNGIAWYDENSGRRTHPVGRKAPNGWGLHDMLGNVWEWTGDWVGAYPGGTVTDLVAPGSIPSRVIRGGGWNLFAGACRSAIRTGFPPGDHNHLLGFRLLREE